MATDAAIAGAIDQLHKAAGSINSRASRKLTTLLASDRNALYAALSVLDEIAMARARYKLTSTVSVPTPSYDVVISTIPNNTAIPAGTSYTLDLSAYVSGADSGSATLSLTEVSGTLAAVDLAFSSPNLAGTTPDVGSVSLQLVATISGATIATSNTFIQGVITVAGTDAAGPAVSPPPTTSVVSGTQINVTTLIPSDPNADGTATGMASLQWQRAAVTSGAVGSFSNVGTAVSLSVGQKPSWTSGTVGGSVGTVTQSGANFNISVTAGALADTSDSFAYAATQLSGAFDVFMYIPTWTSTEEWDERGCGVWQSMAADSKRYTIARFNPELGGHGVVDSWRSTTAGSRSNGTPVTTVANSVWVRFARAAGSSTITGYYFNASSGAWVQLSTPSVTMTDPVYLVVYGCRNVAGAATTSTTQYVSVSTLAAVTRLDTGLTAGNFYQYRAVFTDVQGNSTTGSSSPTTRTTPASSGVKFSPGHYFESYHQRPTYPDAVANNNTELDEAATNTQMRGYMGEYSAYYLETSAGVYNTSQIDYDLAKLAALTISTGRDWKLIIYLCATEGIPSLASTPQRVPYASGSESYRGVFPDYWIDAGYCFSTGYGNSGLKLDNNAAVDRLIALVDYLGSVYDSNPAVEAIIPIYETGTHYGAYSPNYAGIRANVQRLATAMKVSWPTTRKILFGNWNAASNTSSESEADFCSMMDAWIANGSGFGVGGPDILTPSGAGYETQGAQWLRGAIGTSGDKRGTIGIAYCDQAAGVSFPSETTAFMEPYVYGTLQANYVSWINRGETGTGDAKWSQTKSVNAAQSWRIHSTTPSTD